MGAGWQRWWRDTRVLEEREPNPHAGDPPDFGSDAIETKVKSWANYIEHPPAYWTCGDCFVISNKRFHCCPATGYRYTIDMSGLGFRDD